jgi:hypothetical protein
MNLESTLTWPLTCPKDGVHLCVRLIDGGHDARRSTPRTSMTDLLSRGKRESPGSFEAVIRLYD